MSRSMTTEAVSIPHVAGWREWEPPRQNTAVYFPPGIAPFGAAFELSYLSVATAARRMGIVVSGLQKRIRKNQEEHAFVNGRAFVPSHVPAARSCGTVRAFRVEAETADGMRFSRIIYDREEFLRFAEATARGEWRRASREFRPWRGSRPAEIWHTDRYFVQAVPPEHPDRSRIAMAGKDPGEGRWMAGILRRDGELTTSVFEDEETWKFFSARLRSDTDGAVETWFSGKNRGAGG